MHSKILKEFKKQFELSAHMLYGQPEYGLDFQDYIVVWTLEDIILPNKWQGYLVMKIRYTI